MRENKDERPGGKKPNHYTAEFKESAVKLAIESDQPVSRTADELGINMNTLHTWIGKYHKAKGPKTIISGLQRNATS